MKYRPSSKPATNLHIFNADRIWEIPLISQGQQFSFERLSGSKVMFRLAKGREHPDSCGKTASLK
jgi:hypothetical protein